MKKFNDYLHRNAAQILKWNASNVFDICINSIEAEEKLTFFLLYFSLVSWQLMNRFIDDVWLVSVWRRWQELLTFLTVNRSACRKVVGFVAEVILHVENICSRYTQHSNIENISASDPTTCENKTMTAPHTESDDDDDDYWAIHSGYPFFTLNVLLRASHDGRPGSSFSSSSSRFVCELCFFLLFFCMVTSRRRPHRLC